MRIKITATLTYETERTQEDYPDLPNPPRTDDEILAYERESYAVDGDLCDIVGMLISNGAVSDFKIEKVEEKVEAV
jgi:hypothetical protein